MANAWFDGANTSIRHAPKGVAQDDRYPARGVLHTTETEWMPSYRAPSAPPHFTVMPNGVIYQHIAVDECSGALRNVYPGHEDEEYDTGIDPDRTGRLNIQIEVVGYARQAQWPEVQVASIAKIMRWAEEEWGLPARFADVVFEGGAAYGYENEYELTEQEWLDLNAWVGHQHVPENTHWDPGEWLAGQVKEKLNNMSLKDVGQRVGVDEWFEGVWDRATEDGVVNENTDPDDVVTKEELVAVLYRVTDLVEAGDGSAVAEAAARRAAKAEAKADRANTRLDGIVVPD